MCTTHNMVVNRFSYSVLQIEVALDCRLFSNRGHTQLKRCIRNIGYHQVVAGVVINTEQVLC